MVVEQVVREVAAQVAVERQMKVVVRQEQQIQVVAVVVLAVFLLVMVVLVALVSLLFLFQP